MIKNWKILRNFSYLNSKFFTQKSSSYFLNQNNSFNSYILENKNQMDQLNFVSQEDKNSLLKLKEINSYPFYQGPQKNLISVLENFANKRTYVKKLTGIINNSISTAESQQIDTLNINSLLKNEEATLELFYLCNYLNFSTTFKQKENKSQKIKNLNFNTNLDFSQKDLSFIEAIASGKNIARDLLNQRANFITPFAFLDKALKFSNENQLKMQIFKDTELIDQNLNLIYSVGKGSINKPAFFCIEYKNSKSEDYTALIGKGITFDTGGNNLKPTNYIEDMFMDKGGACATFAAFQKIVELKLQTNVILCIPLAENSCDGKSYRPSDVIQSYKGLTVEINNTDAEGRLLLADAMSWAQKNYKVKRILELSTLTGACMVALGLNFAGLFSNSEDLANKILQGSGRFGEYLWNLPLDEEIAEGLKGGYSDLVNSTKQRYGGAIEAAEFLKNFVEEGVEWVHLDIAGVALDKKLGNKGNQPFGSGFGVATILNYFRDYN